MISVSVFLVGVEVADGRRGGLALSQPRVEDDEFGRLSGKAAKQ